MSTTHKAYRHVSLSERVEIYRLYDKQVSLRQIAKYVGRDVGTISRELKRNRTRQYKQYMPVMAQAIAGTRTHRQRTAAPLKNPEVFVYVRGKLKQKQWSPEMIAGRIRIDLPHQYICHETIYQYIYGKGKRQKLFRYLRNHRTKRRRQDGRCARKTQQHSRIPFAVSIEKRPQKVHNRRQVGHFETDLMEGVRSEKYVLSVEVERKTRYTILTKLPNKQAITKQNILTEKLKTVQLLAMANIPIVRSITADNESENTNHRQIAQALGIAMYFAHAYAPWEKGTVENTIGRIRYFIPKGTTLVPYTDTQIQLLENKLNDTPRKCLNWLKPDEAMAKEVNRYKFRKYKKSLCCTSS